jgi:hypothetical protein
MKKTEIDSLIRYIVQETLSALDEAHDRGEWWIDESGGTIFADGDVGDDNHEKIVIVRLTHEILSHYGIEEDEPSHISDYEESILQSLKAHGRLSEEDLAEWESSGPSEVIVKKLVEDKAFGDAKQTEDAVYIAYGSQTRDARDYAMRYWRWKVMKTFGNAIEVQSWHLKPEDIGIIVRGVWDIMGEDFGDGADDPDSAVGEDGYPGPRINVTVQATGKRFKDVPLAVLEKKMPQRLHNYQSGVHTGYNEAINESFHHLHKDYRLYEGNRHIVAIFEDGTRMAFEVHFRNKRGEDKEKWRHRAFTSWKSCANEIFRDVELTEAGNAQVKSWKQCFKEALKHPKMADFIRTKKTTRVFGEHDTSPICDPVNFTRMG